MDQAQRDEWIGKGICPVCQVRPLMFGKSKCIKCAEYARQHDALKYKDRKANHKCLRCGRQLDPRNPLKVCEPCREKHTEWLRERKQWQRENGFCTLCGGPRDDSHKICSGCRAMMTIKQIERNRENRDYRRKHNLCITCGGKRDNKRFVQCSACREKDRIRHAKGIKGETT